VSETPDPLEAELAALRPRGVSPELRRRVADRLATRPTRRWPWAVALVAVLASAGGLALVAPWNKELPPPVPPVVVPAPPAVRESPDPAPSVLAYQRALARSPEELTALLDRHAAVAPDPVPVAAFTRSNATLDALLGDD
jgi:hypothetical protein